MITLAFWITFEVESYISYLQVVLGTIFTIALDILLLPLEIIAFLLHRLIEGEW